MNIFFSILSRLLLLLKSSCFILPARPYYAHFSRVETAAVDSLFSSIFLGQISRPFHLKKTPPATIQCEINIRFSSNFHFLCARICIVVIAFQLSAFWSSCLTLTLLLSCPLYYLHPSCTDPPPPLSWLQAMEHLASPVERIDKLLLRNAPAFLGIDCVSRALPVVEVHD